MTSWHGSLVLTMYRNLPVVPVVVDPILARHLRPHQKEGQVH